jgi:hypothetical protein
MVHVVLHAPVRLVVNITLRHNILHHIYLRGEVENGAVTDGAVDLVPREKGGRGGAKRSKVSKGMKGRSKEVK